MSGSRVSRREVATAHTQRSRRSRTRGRGALCGVAGCEVSGIEDSRIVDTFRTGGGLPSRSRHRGAAASGDGRRRRRSAAAADSRRGPRTTRRCASDPERVRV